MLHSTKDTYKSLVCDLQEPFRCRIDRFIVKAINRSILQEKHFEIGDNGKFSMTGTGVGLYLEAFEREMGVRLAGDGGTLGQLLAAQVRALRSWVEGKFPLHFYRAGTQPGSSRKIRSIIPQMPG
jgi:CRISPR/Cas system-associated endonuclease Cas1